MDRPILKDSMRLFESMGNIRSRSMFGGFGLFANEVMFALVVKNVLHIRADKNSLQEFTQQGLTPYVYKKRGFPVTTKYFALPEASWESPETILAKAKKALIFAQQDKVQQSVQKTARLKDLPNMRLATERMLKKVGIQTVADLHRLGAASAFKAMQANQANALNLELLWSLEGAIKGKHWSVISSQRRNELMSTLD